MMYPFSVVLTKEGLDSFWVAKSSCLKGCIGVGASPDEAIKELEQNEVAWLETAKEVGIAIPEVPVEEENSFSGKFSLRISPSVHKKAVAAAKREGISLNQFINDAIVNYSAEISSAEYISDYVSMTAQEIGKRSLIGTTLSKQNRIYSFPQNSGMRWNNQLRS